MRWSVWVVVAGLALAACTPSRVDPRAEVSISGRWLAGDGAPLAEQPVALHVDPGPSVLLWVPAIVATLGAACATGVCGADHETTTDPAGRFTFDLRGDDVAGSFGEEVDLVTEVVAPGSVDDQSGPAGRVRFVVRDEVVTLPELTLWEPVVDIAGDTVRWDGGPGQVDVSGYELLFQSAGGQPLWRTAARPDGASVDPRVLEDSAGGVAGVATLARPGADDVVGMELRTGTRRYRSLAGAPVSRGAACDLLTSDGSTTPLVPCPVADGDLAAVAALAVPCPEDGVCPQLEGIDVRLADTRDVELVVVRGCPGCLLEVGDDSAQLTSDATAVPVAARAAAIRLTGDLEGLREVSAWDGPGAAGLEAVTIDAPRPVDVGPPSDLAEPGPTGQVDDPAATRSAWPVLLATLLLGAAVGGLAVTLVARRGRAAGGD